MKVRFVDMYNEYGIRDGKLSSLEKTRKITEFRSQVF